MSQNTQVLEYIKKYGSITQNEAFYHLSIMRLAARVRDLKDENYIIYRTMIPVHNRNGDLVKVARYWMPG